MHNEPKLNLVVGVTGASGAVYAASFLRALIRLVPGQSALVISPSAIRVYNEEMNSKISSANDFLDEINSGVPGFERLHTFRIFDHADIGAKPASGSTPTDGMAIVPCSMKTLSVIASGYTSNLIERAADVCLKERRRLVVVPRETPYSLVHLKNMTALTEAGGIVLPASPGFYQKPQSIEELGNFIAGRVLSLFGVRHSLFRGWGAE